MASVSPTNFITFQPQFDPNLFPEHWRDKKEYRTYEFRAVAYYDATEASEATCEGQAKSRKKHRRKTLNQLPSKTSKTISTARFAFPKRSDSAAAPAMISTTPQRFQFEPKPGYSITKVFVTVSVWGFGDRSYTGSTVFFGPNDWQERTVEMQVLDSNVNGFVRLALQSSTQRQQQ